MDRARGSGEIKVDGKESGRDDSEDREDGWYGKRDGERGKEIR